MSHGGGGHFSCFPGRRRRYTGGIGFGLMRKDYTVQGHRKLVVVDVAALGWDLVSSHRAMAEGHGFRFRRTETVFPALTCPVQASFRTAAHPGAHGMVANGFYARRLARPFFWEQSAGLVQGRRIWSSFRAAGGRVGMLFWQQSLGEAADLVLSPRPVHRHHGGLIQDCQSVPDDLYAILRGELGRGFPLHRYWGPLASIGSSEWIADAAGSLLRDEERSPDVLMVYLPHLDYDLQRFGPADPRAVRALDETLGLLARIWGAAREAGAEVLAFGDYAIAPVTGAPVFPLRHLRRHDLFHVRPVRGRLYPDFFGSRVVAIADHEIALVYARDPESVRAARSAFESLDGVALVLDAEAQRNARVGGTMGADLLLVAAEGRWFAYPWWDERREAPDFASHIDIHNKPGYDPCELFSGFPPTRISSDPARIRGTHGRAGASRAVAWASTLAFRREPEDLPALAQAVGNHLDGRGV